MQKKTYTGKVRSWSSGNIHIKHHGDDGCHGDKKKPGFSILEKGDLSFSYTTASRVESMPTKNWSKRKPPISIIIKSPDI